MQPEAGLNDDDLALFVAAILKQSILSGGAGLSRHASRLPHSGKTTRVSTRPEGFEPPTVGLEIRCSIRLSYGRLISAYHLIR